MIAVQAVVRGQVQGVGYRWSAVQQAERLGLAGWVRNRADGAVEVHVEGDEQPVEEFLRWCQEGPRSAEVADLETSRVEPQQHDGFRVR